MTTESQDQVAYTSFPIQNFSIGKFQFAKGKLLLSAADAEVLDKILAASPKIIQKRVRKIDIEGANALAKKFMTGGATKTIDSSLRIDPSQAGNPIVGSEDIKAAGDQRVAELNKQEGGASDETDPKQSESESGDAKPSPFKFGS